MKELKDRLKQLQAAEAELEKEIKAFEALPQREQFRRAFARGVENEIERAKLGRQPVDLRAIADGILDDFGLYPEERGTP